MNVKCFSVMLCDDMQHITIIIDSEDGRTEVLKMPNLVAAEMGEQLSGAATLNAMRRMMAPFVEKLHSPEDAAKGDEFPEPGMHRH